MSDRWRRSLVIQLPASLVPLAIKHQDGADGRGRADEPRNGVDAGDEATHHQFMKDVSTKLFPSAHRLLEALSADRSGNAFLLDFARKGRRYEAVSARVISETAWNKTGRAIRQSMTTFHAELPKR